MATKTIVDSRGDVWTGKEVEPDAISRVASAIITLGLSEALPRDTTVEVNEERHSGKEVK